MEDRLKLPLVALAGLLVASCSEPAANRSADAPQTNAAATAVMKRASKAAAAGNTAVASTLAPFTVTPARLNGAAAPLEWGSHIRAPKEVQAPLGTGGGLIILGPDQLSTFDITIAGADGHHLYVECALAPNPRRDVRFESVVSAAGPAVATMTLDPGANLYFAVTPVVRASPDRPNAHFVISAPSGDPAGNLFLRACTVLPFKAD